jgi:hemerythrin
LLWENFGIAAAQHDLPATRQDKTTGGDVMKNDWVMPSVGIQSMDDEHELCEEALALLLAVPTVKSLTKVMGVLTEHFQHEEKLMKQSRFGRPGEQFSPYANHVIDHERILDIG